MYIGDTRLEVLTTYASTLDDGLCTTDDLARTTIYFSFYLLETLASFDRMDLFFARLRQWGTLVDMGFRTPVESPEPSRSDCHAWGSHPLFHATATVLGIRPGTFGFETVTVQPRLGPLRWARGFMPHPHGPIRADLRRQDGRVVGTVELPAGLTGTLHVNGTSHELAQGVNRAE